jgi:type I phosphodiesterase/nucleotide pyrophosphatase
MAEGRDGEPEPVLPDYPGACIANVVAALRARGDSPPEWLPRPVVGAPQAVLLVLDGLGWDQLRERAHLAPTLSAMEGRSITSVAPTTTAVALTSITTGLPPAAHEVVGYRVKVGGDEVLNVLRWRTAGGDARHEVVPADFQTHPVFGGEAPAVVTKSEFAATGFTQAHLGGVRLHGWRVPSSLPVQVGELLGAGERFVYAYYDGIDSVAHLRGFGAYYDAELRAVDRLVADVLDVLPHGAALLVTADHGQVEVGDASVPLGPDVMAEAELVSGEGRFRWLHARPGRGDRLLAAATAAFGELAWVRTIEELEDGGWFGGRLTDAGRSRLGDVAVIPHRPVAVTDPDDTGELALRCRHGSVTPAEMLVPLLATVC